MLLAIIGNKNMETVKSLINGGGDVLEFLNTGKYSQENLNTIAKELDIAISLYTINPSDKDGKKLEVIEKAFPDNFVKEKEEILDICNEAYFHKASNANIEERKEAGYLAADIGGIMQYFGFYKWLDDSNNPDRAVGILVPRGPSQSAKYLDLMKTIALEFQD